MQRKLLWFCAIALPICAITISLAQSQQDSGNANGNSDSAPSSYMPVDIKEPFSKIMARMKTDKPAVMRRQQNLLEQRYDLSDRPASGVAMTRGKAIQQGVRAKLTQGITWDKLGNMRPEEIRAKDVYPAGFFPLPHPNHPEGGMLFPHFQIDEMKKSSVTWRDSISILTYLITFFPSSRTDLPDHAPGSG